MSRRLAWGRHVLLVLLGVGFAACSLDSDPPDRNGSAAPVSSGVMLSGAGAPDDGAAVGVGEGSRISDINGSSSNQRASTDGMPGGTDSADAFVESVGDTGGAASSASGAAGAGGGPAGSAGKSASGGSAGSSAKDPPPMLWFSEYVEGLVVQQSFGDHRAVALRSRRLQGRHLLQR